jgi:flagellar L-ring protein precursor FlgH
MRGLGLLVALAILGCGPRRPRLPPPPPPEIALMPPSTPATGSLWRPELAGNYAFVDVRAHFPGDLLTVVISEQSRGSKDATTETSAESSIAASVQEFFGVPAAAIKFLPKGFNPESIVQGTTARSSTGEGETTRNGNLSASITVRVVAVDQSGNLRVQGDKVITVNREEQYIVLTGTVRPEDIAADNSVLSSRIADAHIDYYGKGTVGDKQRTPLVHRLMDWLWPF